MFLHGWARLRLGLSSLVMLLCLNVPAQLLAADSCEAEANWTPTPAQRHFMVLAGRTGVFYDRSGVAFVMLIKATAEAADIGAIGIYADESRQPRFGAVPAATYENFMSEARAADEVMLRLELTAPQYSRVLSILETWDRRVHQGALLYPEIAMDNILLVKQATEELNRCGSAIAAYPLDWGLEDEISENNSARRIPFEYFKRLKQLNPDKHVPDEAMPGALLTAFDASQNSAAQGQISESSLIKE
jgi:hypothetical protein